VQFQLQQLPLLENPTIAEFRSVVARSWQRGPALEAEMTTIPRVTRHLRRVLGVRLRAE
jgi:hypothetical protein